MEKSIFFTFTNYKLNILFARGVIRNSFYLIPFFLLLSKFTTAQVLENFDNSGSIGIFKNENIGTITDSIFQTPDPTGKSVGVMDVRFDLKGMNDINSIGLANQKMSLNGAQQLSYWIYIPRNSTIPDSLVFVLWMQSTASWGTAELDYYAIDIPKDVWFPLSFPLTDSSISNPQKNDLSSHQIGDFGIKWNNNHCTSTMWKGDVYFDNVSLIGSQPTLFTDFKLEVNGFSEQWNNGWKDSITQISGPIGDSTGVLQFKLFDGTNKTGGTALGIQPVNGYNATKQSFLVFWVFVDSTFPDSAYLQVFAQDNSNWSWPQPAGIRSYYGKDIIKNAWYPVYFDMSQATILDTVSLGSYLGLFNGTKYPLGKFGLQVDAPKTWKGSVYVDKVEFINSTVTLPPEWIAANFENNVNGLQGFAVPSYAEGTISRVLDQTTGNNSYVMEGDIDFSKTPSKFAAFRNGISIMDATSKYASKASFDIYVPAVMPSGSDIQFTLTGAGVINSSGLIQSDNFLNSQLTAGQWNTIWMNLNSLVNTGSVDPTKQINIGVQIAGPSNSIWSGKLFFDNLTFYGITQQNQLTVVKNSDSNLPKEFKLYNNYPNPFNPSTMIKYDLPKQSKVVIKVYDILGKEVATLVNTNESAGEYTLNFNANNLASGMYVYRISAGSYIDSKKMILLK